MRLIKSEKKPFYLNDLKKNKSFIVPFIACLMTGVLLLTLFLVYTENLHKMVEEENYHYLQEISSQINSNMQDKLDSHYSIVKILGNSIVREKEASLDSILAILEEEGQNYGYQNIGLIDENGYLYSNDGKVMYFALIPFISEMDKEQKMVTSNVLNLDNKDSVAFLSPLPLTDIDNIKIKGIVAISDMNTLSDTLSLTMFDNQGFAHVVSNTGAVVIRSNNASNKFDGYNILTYFENVPALEDVSIQQLKDDLLNNKSGQFQYKRNDGMEVQAFYAPSGVENWYLFSVIPSKILDERTSGFYQQTLMVCTVLTIIFVTLIAIIVASHQRRKRELMNVLYTDTVTNGRSKLKFEEDVSQFLKVNKDQYTLIYINIDKFKFINEQYGRVQADGLLKKIYEIVDGSLSQYNKGCVSRLMADHFGVLIHDQSIDEIKKYIYKWNVKVKNYTLDQGFSVPVKITCGLYMLNKDDSINDIFVLLDKANVARKMGDSGNSEFVVAVYDNILKERIDLEQELEARQETALANGEFKMFLQPKYDPQTNQIAGAEGLTRWVSDKGMIYPNQFIPLFESNGFIVKLDLYIFEEACKFIDNLIHHGYRPIPISINLSRRNLTIPNFIDRYIEIWKKYNFAADLLEFEITENLIYENMELLDKTIEIIHGHGFLVSMDDFGSGYSSLNMLKNVDVDFVKLDREFFLSNEQYLHKGEIIIDAMIELCKELGISVVSEGIETQDQVDFLRKVGCDLIQGYYYSKPIAKEELLDKMIQDMERNENEKSH